MLAAIGVAAELEDLFDGLPAHQRFPPLDLPEPVTELEIERELAALADRNTNVATHPCFLGAGTYRHYIPATVDAVLQRSEFATSYTPYQPELSQGMLQATFEYQSMICALTGMDVSTASHYDGATALGEAVLLALHVAGRDRRTRARPHRDQSPVPSGAPHLPPGPPMPRSSKAKQRRPAARSSRRGSTTTWPSTSSRARTSSAGSNRSPIWPGRSTTSVGC